MKKIEAFPSYMIFFDNTRVDQYVKSFSTSVSNDGGISRASIEMLPLPSLDRVHRQTGGGGSFAEDAIDNMTNVKIFIKNVFNGKYSCVFDGNIRGKSVSESPNGNSLSYSAVDHMELLAQTTVLIAIPISDRTGNTATAFRLKAQGIDHEATDPLINQGQLDLKGFTIRQTVDKVVKQALASNAIYSDANGVYHWNDPAGRIAVMGDIDPKLHEAGVIDLQINPNALKVDSMYVLINDIVQKMMFEFFQDRDGTIRIKPPFWHEGVPINHVLDASIVLNYTDHTSWESMYTRVVTTGGVAQHHYGVASEQHSQLLVMPMGVYSGEIGSQGRWADSRPVQSTSATHDLWDGRFSGSQTGVQWLDSNTLLLGWTAGGKGAAWTMRPGGDIRHLAGGMQNGVVREVTQNSVLVELLSGPYAGCMIAYLNMGSTRVQERTVIFGGTLLGHATTMAAGNSVRIEVRTKNYGLSAERRSDQYLTVETIDPIVYCRDIVSERPTASIYAIEATGIDQLIAPSALERKNGISVYEANQPMIRLSNQNQDAYGALRKYSAFMYNMLNSMANTASVQIIGAPWIRPGMNCWLMPTKTDKVYYVASVTHNGDPKNGVYTSLKLVHGRGSSAFFLGAESMFGSLRDKKDNIFINEIATQYDPKNGAFGPIVAGARDYTSVANKSSDFHNSADDGIIKADRSPFLMELYARSAQEYGYGDFSTARAQGITSSTDTLATFLFSSDMTDQQIQITLDAIYDKAPAVVKERGRKIKAAVQLARNNLHLQHLHTPLGK